jgi:hypothetical protein
MGHRGAAAQKDKIGRWEIMIYASIDYPASQVTIHRDPGCRYIEKRPGARRRGLRLDVNSFSTEIRRLAQGEYPMGKGPSVDTLWLEVEFGDEDFELATVLYVKRLLGRQYRSIETARVTVDCPPELRGELKGR